MCIIQNNEGWEETEALPGYEIQKAKEGEKLTNQQREDNWTYGGQSFATAFDDNRWKSGPMGAKKSRLEGYMGQVIMSDFRRKKRDSYGYVADTNNPYINPTSGSSTPSWNRNKLQASEKYG